jgi:hypothetical protein
MKAFVDTFGAWVVLKLPPSAQIGPKLRTLLEVAGFEKCGSEWQQHYRQTFEDETEHLQWLSAARHMAHCYNSGSPIYCKELLQPKQNIQHG